MRHRRTISVEDFDTGTSLWVVLSAFEGGLNLPLLVWPPSRDLTVFAPALFDRL
jgi:hypothetical protein